MARQAPVHGILQVRILDWGAISSSRGSSQPRDQAWVSCVSCTALDSLPLSHLNVPAAAAKSLQSCPTLCDPHINVLRHEQTALWPHPHRPLDTLKKAATKQSSHTLWRNPAGRNTQSAEVKGQRKVRTYQHSEHSKTDGSGASTGS